MIRPILPMLATASEPFDSPDHLFEVKWDGVRALAAVEGEGWRLWGRGLADYRDRYPELSLLRCLPSGTVVDGELVVLREGRANLDAILRRHQLQTAARIHHVSCQTPVVYVVFDLLYAHGQAVLHEPLCVRREMLSDLLEGLAEPRLALSDGVVGTGRRFFDGIVAAGHEGMMAKHLSSRYAPGQRSAAWRKIKPRRELPCVIIGYTPAAAGFDSLLVAACQDGVLRYAGRVASGFSRQTKIELSRRLSRLVRCQPVVPCRRKARWVEPVVYCQVQFLQRSASGRLRGASFKGLLER